MFVADKDWVLWALSFESVVKMPLQGSTELGAFFVSGYFTFDVRCDTILILNNTETIMDNTTALFIRACKSLTPKVRIQSVYRRFYLDGNDGDLRIRTLVSILSGICEQYSLLTTQDIIRDLNPDNYRYLDANWTFYDRCYEMVIDAIRHAPVSKLPDYPVSRKFR